MKDLKKMETFTQHDEKQLGNFIDANLNGLAVTIQSWHTGPNQPNSNGTM